MTITTDQEARDYVMQANPDHSLYTQCAHHTVQVLEKRIEALEAEVEAGKNTVNDRDCEIERLKEFAAKGPYSESTARKCQALESKLEAVRGLQRYDVVECGGHAFTNEEDDGEWVRYFELNEALGDKKKE